MMDYTSLSLVKQEMHITSGSSVDDALLSTLITTASRAWDHKCTGVVDGDNYFASGSIVDEQLVAQVNYTGTEIVCYPRKPIIDSVQAFSFQSLPTEQVHIVDPLWVMAFGPKVTAYPKNLGIDFPSKCFVKISYTGGLGATVSDLPADMVEAVTILVARFYREAESGLTDQIGIAELGQSVYTKAWPVRVTDLLRTYKRHVGWRHVA